MVMNKEAEKRLTKARVFLITRHPFFGTLALGMKPVETTQIPTMATDASHLFYNPDFVMSCNDKVLVAAVAHEVMHVVLLHPFRVKDRMPMAWNAAGDFALNLILKDCHFELGPTWLCDEQYRDMSADEIYNKLPKPPPAGGGGGGKSIDGQPSTMPSDASGDPKDHVSGNGKGQGHWKHDPKCGCGGIAAPKFKDRNEAEAKEIAVKGEIIKAAAVARACGKLPAAIETLVDTMLESKVPWQTLLAAFMERASKNDYSWMRANKRHIHRGFYLPTLHNLEMEDVVVAIDTSGSVPQEELNQFFSEVAAILTVMKPKRITVIQCDAAVGAVDEVTPDDLPLNITCAGRGGTDFRPPFHYIEEQGDTPTVMVYLTDGECRSFPNDPGFPVFWVVTNDKKFEAPFGEVAFM